MMQQHPTVEKPFVLLQQLDLVFLVPGSGNGQEDRLAAARASISGVFSDFLAAQGIFQDRIALVDGFLFLFNGPEFSRWHTLSWWEQRRYIQGIKDHQPYAGRAHTLLARSCLAPYIGYSDARVAASTDQEVKRAWMRKRLVLQECFWNGIDTISHAAYYKKKYRELYPALCVLLCNVIDRNGRETELFLGIDNGTGFVYKKKSRESALFHLCYMVYRFFFRKGVFYIGGLELGLLETESELSCHGSGAVVYQGW